MRFVALTAHGLCDLQQADALVLDWFKSAGLELVRGGGDVLIGWSDASLTPLSPVPSLAVEVRLYDLDGGELQDWAEELLASLRLRLQSEAHRQVDGP